MTRQEHRKHLKNRRVRDRRRKYIRLQARQDVVRERKEQQA